MCHVPGAGAWHLNFQVQGALCKVTWKVGKGGIPEKGSQNAVQKCLFQVASALQSKVMAKTYIRHVPCILPCKIGGLQNLMKKRYLSKTPFLMEKERKLSFCGGEGKIIFWKRRKREKENFSDKWRDLVEFRVRVLGFPIPIHYLECPIPHSNLSTRIQIRVFIFGWKFDPHLASSGVVWDCRIEVCN